MTELVEVWKDVVGHEGLYHVSNLGRVGRLDCVISGRRYKEKLCTLSFTGDGHLQACISSKLITVHSLVLAAFVGPRPSDMSHIRHLDDNPSNNRIDNIVYGTASENALDAHKARRARLEPFRFSKERAVLIKLKLAERIKWTYSEMRELGKEFGVSFKTVSRIRNGTAWGGLV